MMMMAVRSIHFIMDTYKLHRHEEQEAQRNILSMNDWTIAIYYTSC